MRSETIENYLKTIYNLSAESKSVVGNFRLAKKLGIKPASVTEALRKLHDIKYVVYEKSYGTRLTALGARLALNIIRRHRIWETYLVKELGFGWDEVHEIAEELEHVRNDRLINKLSEILGNPLYDPHGDPIPNKRGKIKKAKFVTLAEVIPVQRCRVMGVSDHSASFLKYLDRLRIRIGSELTVKEIENYDRSVKARSGTRLLNISAKAASNLIVETIDGKRVTANA